MPDPNKIIDIPFADSGDVAVIPNAAQLDGSVSYTSGYGPNYALEQIPANPSALDIERNKWNQLAFDVTENIMFWQRYGILEYNTLVEYQANFSRATGSDGKVYACLINTGPLNLPLVDPVGDLTGTWIETTAQVLNEQFPSTLTLTEGRQKFHNGLFVQIGEGQFDAVVADTQTIVLPEAFPTAILGVWASNSSAVGAGGVSKPPVLGAGVVNLSTIEVRQLVDIAYNTFFKYIVWGY